MTIKVIDSNTTWKFNTRKDSFEEMVHFFEELEKNKREVEEVKLIFKEESTMAIVNQMFDSGDGEAHLKEQVITLKPLENEDN